MSLLPSPSGTVSVYFKKPLHLLHGQGLGIIVSLYLFHSYILNQLSLAFRFHTLGNHGHSQVLEGMHQMPYGRAEVGLSMDAHIRLLSSLMVPNGMRITVAILE